MAEQPLTVAIGDALVTFLDFAWPQVALKLEELLETVAEAVRPDPPLSLSTVDGQVVTGVAVIERGKVIAFIGTRQPGQQPQPWRSHRDDPPFDDNAPLWGRDVRVDPYRRHP
jgi:hypothetical protein